jgi:cellulose biosynthesis protein BcsQ
MECGWNSPEAISACIAVAHSWLRTVGDLVGLGSAALITALLGYLLIVRRRRDELETLLKERQKRVANAEEAQRQFEPRIDAANTYSTKLETEVAELNDQVRLLTEGVRANADAAQTVHDALELSHAGDTAFWRRPPLPLHDAGLPLQLRTHCPSLMFANQKGGVGKSTLVANVAAYFAARGFNVLAVDLDYQGTLTNQMRLLQFGPGGPPFGQALDAKTVLRHPFRKADWSEGQINEAIVTATTDIPPATPDSVPGRLCYLANDYELSQVERAVEYGWMLNALADDPRYRLAAFLAHAAEVLRLDYILIDAPPRFTLGFINGLAASTDLFVPTVVDTPSARAVETFARQFADLAPRLNPTVRWGGTIGTMTTGTTSALPQNMRSLAQSTEFAVRNRIPNAGPFFYYAAVPRSAELSKSAAMGIPYLCSKAYRDSGIIQTLGDQILTAVTTNGTPTASSDASQVEQTSTA